MECVGSVRKVEIVTDAKAGSRPGGGSQATGPQVAGPQISGATKARREAEERRLAQALRDNLAKRKAQGRARQGEEAEIAPTETVGTD